MPTIATSIAAARRRQAKRVAAGVPSKPPAIFCRCPNPDGVVMRTTGVVVCQRCALVVSPGVSL
jgi:hypothetical protein